MTSSDAGGDAPGTRLTDFVSVVVCAKNAAATIGDTLQSIVANHPHEIIVIDDQSRDNTAEVARRFTERVLPSPGSGLAAARQFGVEQATCRYVSFVDSDVVLSDGCLEALTTVLERDATVACASATTVQMVSHSRWLRGRRELLAGTYQRHVGPTNSVGLRASLFRRAVLMELPFDPFFVGAAEDWDLAIRLRAAGWHLHRCEALAYHHDRATLWALFKQRLWYGRGDERLRLKHGANASTSNISRPLPPGRTRLRHLLLRGQYEPVVCALVLMGAFRLGRLLERIALWNTPYPHGGTPSHPS